MSSNPKFQLGSPEPIAETTLCAWGGPEKKTPAETFSAGWYMVYSQFIIVYMHIPGSAVNQSKCFRKLFARIVCEQQNITKDIDSILVVVLFIKQNLWEIPPRHHGAYTVLTGFLGMRIVHRIRSEQDPRHGRIW